MAASSLWEALAGRAPGRPIGPAEPDVYDAVIERLNPAKARPRLRVGIEEAHLVSVRGAPYVMLRSPGEPAAYLRLDPSEVELARRMDGSRSVGSLVGEFARITGRLAPPQVIRVVADLAANRMLEELPVDAFHAVRPIGRRSPVQRIRRTVGDVLRGRQFATVRVDGLATFLYRAGGRLLFTRAGAMTAALVAVVGALAFAVRWIEGEQAVFVVANSHALGALALLGLNVVCVAAHELGHALAAKHAGRQVPVGGVMLYFGIPSVFVDTSDVWMAGRRARLLTAASGPLAAVVLAGAVNIAAVVVPELAGAAFKLGFLWYLNVVFNLNPLLALDGYHMLMDWLELPNLRARGLALAIARLRQRRLGWAGLSGENRLYAMYGTAAVFWLVVTLGLGIRMWKDRIDGLGASLWHEGIGGQAGVALIVGLILAPLIGSALGRIGDAMHRRWAERRERKPSTDIRRRLEVLRRSALMTLEPMTLAELAGRSSWMRPAAGGLVPGLATPAIVAAGLLEGTGARDAPGVVRRRALTGDVVDVPGSGADGIDIWRAYDARLLVLPPGVAVPSGSSVGREAVPFAAAGRRGLHGDSSPALVWPAGAIPPAEDGSTDRRLARRFLWLLLLLGGLALLSMLVAAPPGPAWSELGDQRALASVEHGTATVHRRDSSVNVGAGSRIAVRAGESIEVWPESRVDLLFRGGSTGRLCSGSVLGFVALSTIPGDPDRPTASLELPRGALALSIAAPSGAHAGLRVDVRSGSAPPVLASATREALVVASESGVRMVNIGTPVSPDTWCDADAGGLAQEEVAAPAPSAAVSSQLPSPAANAPTHSPSQGSSGQPATSVPSLESPAAAPASADPTDQPGETAGPTATASSATPAPTRPPTAAASPRPATTRSPAPTATSSPQPTPSPTPTSVDDFSIACSPGILKATAGQSVVAFCTITSIGSFSSAVSLACADIGGLATCTYAPGSVTPPGGGTALAEVIVRVQTAARPGCHALSIAATAGSLNHRASVQLDIASKTGPSCQGGSVR